MKKIYLLLMLLLIFRTESYSAIRNVPAQYSSIQSAIDASSNGDTVLVQPGTYYENINFRDRNIVLTSLFYQSMNLSFISNTIINGSNPVHPDTASCVIISGRQDSTAVLQGFTLTGGKGTIWNDEHFAGFYREGGGLLTALSNPVIRYNIIRGNHCIDGGIANSTGGGGVRIGDGFVRFYNNFVMENSARYGAGIVLNYAGGDYRNNVIVKNFGSMQFGGGAGVWMNNTYTRPRALINNTIAFNKSSGQSPGIYNTGGLTTFISNIVWGNTGGNNTQFSGPQMLVTYSNVQGGITGAGNISTEPLFDTTNFYLNANSPCIDMGDTNSVFSDPADPGSPGQAKWPARGGLRNDIGAYGGPMSTPIANSIVSVNSSFGVSIPGKISLSQNYPNPFNPSATIIFELPEITDLKLSVYDCLGREVSILYEGAKPAGRHAVRFDGSNLPSGVYYCRLKAGNISLVRAMTLIK